jgi:hypothetical protein
MKARKTLLIVALLALSIIALPTPALAKAKTKTRVSSSQAEYVVDASNPALPPATPSATVKLSVYSAKKHRYTGFRGAVYVYRRDSDGVRAGVGTFVTNSAGYVSFPLSARGDYRITYGGSKANKVSSTTVTRFDHIGATLSEPTFAVTSLGNGYSRVDVSLDATWDSAIYPTRILALSIYAVSNETDFNNLAGEPPVYGLVTQIYPGPGTIGYSAKIKDADVLNFAYFNDMSSVMFKDTFIQDSPRSDSYRALR